MNQVKFTSDGNLKLSAAFSKTLNWKEADTLEAELQRDGKLIISKKPLEVADAIPFNYSSARKNLETEIRYLKGVGPKTTSLLARKGIVTVEDALYLFPIRYEDRRKLTPVAILKNGDFAVIAVEVLSAESLITKGGKRYFEAVVKDDTGSITCKWFISNPVYLKKDWKPGARCIITGTVVQFGFQREIHHPEVEWLGEAESVENFLVSNDFEFNRLVPVYPLTEGLHQKTLRKVMKVVLENFSAFVTNCIPEEICQRNNLLDISESLRRIHSPLDDDYTKSDESPALNTLVFDEFFFLELGLALKHRGSLFEKGISFQVNHTYTKQLIKLLPYSLTESQKKVLTEIKNDMISPYPMHRLVQGDVGCGKTLVALMAALIAVENGYQVAMMAPTEILAEQHYLSIHRMCDHLGIKTVLITSSLKASDRTSVLAAVADGTASIVIGTHAVLEERVEFNNLGLGIIDEQHRFGVIQRSALKKKGMYPDILVMTATPIPRTLSMTVFGDMSISVISELPPGRMPVKTFLMSEKMRGRAYSILSDEISKGNKAYIVYPLIDNNESTELKAAVQMSEQLKTEIFPNLRIALLHGRLKPEEKEQVMLSFKNGETDILVATTVIEVGIDVPDATAIMIEHAERFGLSQLHQLRGRVGRGSSPSICILMASEKISEDGVKRLNVMQNETDGFKIAEADLSIRGPGDFMGTRQSGMPELKIANLLRDAATLEATRKEAFGVIEKDPDLSTPSNMLLKEELYRRWNSRLELASVA